MNTAISRTLNLLSHGEYIPTEYFIFDEQQLIYISIPKVACTSIKIALMANELGASSSPKDYMNVHTKTSKHMKHSIGRSQKNYFKFAFVRNPFDRLVSCYKDKVKKEIQHNGRYHFDTNYNNVLIYRLFNDKFRSDMSFGEFVQLASKIPDFLADGHFKSQYSMLYKRNKQIPNVIGRFENLARDWQKIADQHGLTALADKNPGEKDDWRGYYSSREIVNSVAKRFRHDIDLFDYSANYNDLIDRL